MTPTLKEILEGFAGADLLAERLLRQPLFPAQHEALTQTAVLRGRNLLYLAPTGSGKSLVAEAAAVPHLLRGGMVVWLVPTRALARERADRLAVAFGPQ